MKLRAAFFVATSMLALAAFARFGFACDGGASDNGSDGAPSAATCAENMVLVGYIGREDPSIASCTTDSDCVHTIARLAYGHPCKTPRFVQKTAEARMS